MKCFRRKAFELPCKILNPESRRNSVCCSDDMNLFAAGYANNQVKLRVLALACDCGQTLASVLHSLLVSTLQYKSFP